MSGRSIRGTTRRRTGWGLVLLGAVSLLASACTGRPAVATVQAAKVEAVEGSPFKRLSLTPDAVKRLAIQTTPLREEQVTRKRLVGGEVITPGGNFTVTVRLSPDDYDNVDVTQPVSVKPLKVTPGAPARTIIAQPVPDAGAFATGGRTGVVAIAVNYTLPADHGFLPADKVMAEVTLKGGGLRKVVPYSSLIYELDGTTWIYTNPEPNVFIRARADTEYVEGDRAVMTAGPAAGTPIVSVGATELYGLEFRTGK